MKILDVFILFNKQFVRKVQNCNIEMNVDNEYFSCGRNRTSNFRRRARTWLLAINKESRFGVALTLPEWADFYIQMSLTFNSLRVKGKDWTTFIYSS